MSEDEEEEAVSVANDYNDFENDQGYEFDVQLKVWRRSRANLWRASVLD